MGNDATRFKINHFKSIRILQLLLYILVLVWHFCVVWRSQIKRSWCQYNMSSSLLWLALKPVPRIEVIQYALYLVNKQQQPKILKKWPCRDMLVSFERDFSCVSLVGLLLQHLARVICLQYKSVTFGFNAAWHWVCVTVSHQACDGETTFSVGCETQTSLSSF